MTAPGTVQRQLTAVQWGGAEGLTKFAYYAGMIRLCPKAAHPT